MKDKKVVEMKNTPKEAPKQERMSYEQLHTVAVQLSEQVQDLTKKLHQVELTNMFTRINYLVRILDSEYLQKTKLDFVKACADELEESMKLYEEGDVDEEVKK